MPYIIKHGYRRWIGYRILILVPVFCYFFGYELFYELADLGGPGSHVSQVMVSDYTSVKIEEFAHRYYVVSIFLLELFLSLGVALYIGWQFFLTERHSHAQTLLFPVLYKVYNTYHDY